MGINYTWFIIFFLVTFSLGAQFPALWNLETRWTAALVTSLLFFGSVLGHELSHSVVALSYGIPVKGITLFVFGGVSQIAREATKPLNEVLIAIAGPVMSLVLAGLFYGVEAIADPFSDTLSVMAGWLGLINLNLAIFNLIPGFPLDGGRVLRAILWWARGDYRSSTRIAVWVGRGVAWTFIVGGVISALGAPLVARLTGYEVGFMGGLWLAFIGWFLDSAASATYSQMLLRESLQGYTAGDLMARELPVVPFSTSLRRLVEENVLRQGNQFFLVTTDGRLHGIITLRNITAVPKERWDMTTAGDAMTPLGKLHVISAKEDAFRVLEQMDEHDINQMPVVEADTVVGMVTRDRLLHFIRVRTELQR